MDQLEQLDEQYREHHRTSRERDFVYAGHDRSELFARYVAGPGRRVRDIGCRTGALTRAYLEGNEVVGLDVDRESLAEAAKLGIETHWADADQPLPMGGIPSTTRRQLQLLSPDDVSTFLHGFDEPKLHFVSSRFIRLHPRLTANVIVFSARKPS